MNIASRTPEGESNRCPICDHTVCIEHSRLFGDACCPHCGTLLWYISIDHGGFFFVHKLSRDKRERVYAVLAERLGIAPEKLAAHPPRWDQLGIDSLDTVELVMELEEEFDH